MSSVDRKTENLDTNTIAERLALLYKLQYELTNSTLLTNIGCFISGSKSCQINSCFKEENTFFFIQIATNFSIRRDGAFIQPKFKAYN